MQGESDRNFSDIHLTSAREITWSIQNLNPADRLLDSPPFVLQNATWCLRLYLSDANNIGLMIVRLSSRVPRHRLKYSFKLKGEKTTRVYEAVEFDEDHKEAGDKRFVTRQYLNIAGIMIDDRPRECVQVTCEISCYGLPVADDFSRTELSMHDAKDVEVLCRDFKNVLLNGQHHDVVLRVKDKEFPAHRDVLRARSPVFQSMLSHDMNEKNVGVVDIPDCDPTAFEQFLLYLYGGEMNTLDAEIIRSLYYIADKYDVRHLHEKCREFIKNSLSTRNITDVVQLALDHSDEYLLRWATDYFVREVNEILPTVEWMSFMNRNTVQANELFMKAARGFPDSKEMAG